jgi:hypothetical protein
MKSLSAEWHKLRWPLLLLTGTSLAMLLLVFGSHRQNHVAAIHLQQQTQRLNLAVRQYQAAERQKVAFAQFQPLMKRLRSAGDEINAERLQNLQTFLAKRTGQLTGLGIRLSLSAEESFKLFADEQAGALQLHHTGMSINFVLTHERELLSLLKALRASEATPFLVRECEIRPLKPAALNSQTGHLYASCKLDWITLGLPEKDKAPST